MAEKTELEIVDFNPFENPEILLEIGLTDAQTEIWLACALGGPDASLSYNESISLDFRGSLNKDLFFRAFDELVGRHEALRMTFNTDGKYLRIYDFLKPEISFHDFSDLDDIQINEGLRRISDDESSKLFDLENGPLIRLNLIKLEVEHHFVVLCAHHLVVDGWSFGVILEDLSSIYNAFLKNKIPELVDPPQFSQYFQEFRAFKGSKEYMRVEQFWLDQYQGNIPQLELPTDFLRPSVRTFRSRRDDFLIPIELVRSVKDLSKNSRSSLVSTLMAAFEIFLYKVSGQKEIVLGLPAAGQSATENLNLVGHCVNLLPLKTEVNPDLSFLDYLNLRRSQVMDAYDHQKFTFGKLLEKLNVLRDPSRIPLVPVVFNIDMGMDLGVKFDGLEFDLLSNPRKYENFEIFLNLTGKNEDIIVEWSYNTDLFRKDTISYWMEILQDILLQVCNDPNIPIRAIGVNRETDLQKFTQWNATFLKLNSEHSLIELFEKISGESPAATAVLTKNEEVSYHQLDTMSQKIAQQLHQEGIRKGDIVAVLLDRTPDLVATLLGIMRSGAAYLPLDPSFPDDRMSYMIEDSLAKVLLTESKYAGKFSGITDEKLIRNYLKNDKPVTPHLKLPEGDSLAYVLYTSGSTGKPKGVKVTHLNLLNFLESMKIDLHMNPQDRLLAITTVSFDIAGLEIFLPLISGASVVLADRDTSRNGGELLDMVKTLGVTTMQATPATWRLLLDSGWDHPLNLKVLCGGEALPTDLAESMLGIFGSFWNVYGPTETTIWSTIKKIENPQEITIGHPIANTQIYILDPNLSPVPIGSIGEICIGGLGVSEGYLNRDELTHEKFVPNPFEINEAACTKIYRTGDLGRYLPNGEIICLGRLDNQVKIRGYRIELGEVEACLNKIEGVKESAITVREDISGEKRLVGYVVPEFQMATIPDSEKIKTCREQLRSQLPDYMIPESWSFLEKLPLTANNKVDRKQLPEPKTTLETSSEEYFPNSYSEQLIFDIWSKTLNQKSFNIKNDFFELGGNSLLAVKIMSQIDEIFGVKLPITTLFLYPTISALAKKLEGNKETHKWPSVVPIKTSGSKNPLVLVHGAGMNATPFYILAQHLNQEQPVYGIQARGLNGIEPPATSILEMADEYVKELLTILPSGKFELGGYCSGGVIAFEMARLLKEKYGIILDKVIMIEADAEQNTICGNWLTKLIYKIKIFFSKIIFNLRILMFSSGICRREKINYYRKKIYETIKKISGFKDTSIKNSIVITIEKLKDYHEKAQLNHRIEPMDIQVALLKTTTLFWWKEDFETYGWKKFCNSVITEEIQGLHDKIFESENVEILAAAVNRILTQK